MTQRFDELYIRRGEHQQIVAYYKKLVVHVSQKLRALQAELDRGAPISKVCDPEMKTSPVNTDPQQSHGNVIRVDFSHPHRLRSRRS